MGAPISEKYESVENTTTQNASSVHLKTKTGNVEHNGVTNWEAWQEPTRAAAANRDSIGKYGK